jgi:hypothetical protein
VARPSIFKGSGSVAGPAAEPNGYAERGNEIVLEIISAAEVAVVEIVLEIDSESYATVLTTAEPQAQTEYATDIGAALIVVEWVAASRQEGRATREIESDTVGHR